METSFARFSKLLAGAAKSRQTLSRRRLIGPGSKTLDTHHRAAGKGKDYKVGFCGGKQERQRRAR